MGSLSIVMPVYNEEEVIQTVVCEISDKILARLPDSELLIVDDGSKDKTPQILDNLCSKKDNIKVFHKPNGGHGSAVLYGLDKACGDNIFLIDSDRQFDPGDFWKLWEQIDSADLVMGIRVVRHDPLHRLILTRLVRCWIKCYFGIPCKDANIPFKLFKRKLWQDVAKFIPENTLAPSIFIAIAAHKRQWEIKEVPVTHLPRKTGTVSIKYFKLLSFCWQGFKQLAEFKATVNRTR